MEKYELNVEAILSYRKWLFSQPTPDAKRFYVEGVELSVSEAVGEIIKRSELGKKIHRMMIDTGKFDKLVTDKV